MSGAGCGDRGSVAGSATGYRAQARETAGCALRRALVRSRGASRSRTAVRFATSLADGWVVLSFPMRMRTPGFSSDLYKQRLPSRRAQLHRGVRALVLDAQASGATGAAKTGDRSSRATAWAAAADRMRPLWPSPISGGRQLARHSTCGLGWRAVAGGSVPMWNVQAAGVSSRDHRTGTGTDDAGAVGPWRTLRG